MSLSSFNYPKISVVINTYNRAHTLPRTLASLKFLRYLGEFEVIVVNGPSTDATNSILQAWSDEIKIGHCSETNLSISRNIGIAMATGELIAFLDDDAIPESNWLNELAEIYIKDSRIGAAGGKVYLPSGVDFQAEFLFVDRLGNSQNLQKPRLNKSFPFSWRFPQNMGCNASYRKDYLLEVGGFDEEIEYYLDETDVCTRLTDAGYIVAQIDGAYVHHKFASSHLRNESSIIENHYPILKNKIYFSNIYAKNYVTQKEIDSDNEKFINSFRLNIKRLIKNDVLHKSELMKFESQVVEAKSIGIKRSNEIKINGRKFVSQKTLETHRCSFKKFHPLTNDDSLEILFVDRNYCEPGGVTTYFKTLATDLSRLGHIVHVICETTDNSETVDFVDGVWVHKITSKNFDMSSDAKCRCIPTHIWNWSYSALNEARRIDNHRHIDVVEAPLWDAEGCAFMFEGSWPVVTFLTTPLAVWLKYNNNFNSNEDFMHSFAKPMLALEKEILTRSQKVKADSAAIIKTVESLYDICFDKGNCPIVHLGIPRNVTAYNVGRKDSNKIQILFVGRLEERKGIDLLLSCIPRLLERYPNINFIIAGDDSVSSNGVNYKQDFLKLHKKNKKVMSNVRFCGKVSKDELELLYKDCDIFVSPSRYESFGLIFLEAMREGKPVIGCDVGGMVEIIEDGFNGLLAKQSDLDSLFHCLEILITDSDLRTKMGKNGFSKFMQHFTSDKMASKSVELYQAIVNC